MNVSEHVRRISFERFKVSFETLCVFRVYRNVEISYRRVCASSIPNTAYFHGYKGPYSPVYQTISSSAVPTIVLDLLYDFYI